ncbi:hypothetical protein [Chryseobacterium sp.]|uniref:hypothetical protein n=1 Tax=Chryseobacterium sp. TaxID=1871047 RepID=UPI000EDBE1A6|nr:hypothetical protein [Chryseobacterium sp.]HCM34031.1 hypothetical protein [Chryseobacterium sp.]
MTTDFYNELQTLYVALSKYPSYSDYFYKENYKCFNNNYFFLKGERTKFLEKLSNISINDIYSDTHKKEMGFPENYLNQKLINFDENRVCIIDSLGPIIYYYILNNLKPELDEFIKQLELAKKDSRGYVKIDNGYLKFHYVEFFEYWIKRFEGNENMKKLIHLFTKTKSHVININLYDEIEINEKKIIGYIETLQHFNFENL